ncbi:MAG: hypothetical protein AAB323_00230 [Pseudomonadota bacterium]
MHRGNIKIKLKDINPCGLSSMGPFSLESLICSHASGLMNVGPLMLKYSVLFEDFPSFIDFSQAGTSCELLDALDNLANQLELGEALLETNAENPNDANQAKFNYLLLLLANGRLSPTCTNVSQCERRHHHHRLEEHHHHAN